MSIIVEQAHEATITLVMALRRLLPQLTGATADVDITALAQVLAQPELALLVAHDEAGLIVGTATLIVVMKSAGCVAILEDVVVDAGARGRGIGAELTNAAIQVARARGAQHLDLTSSPRREAANRLYQRLGFARRETNLYRFPLTT